MVGELTQRGLTHEGTRRYVSKDQRDMLEKILADEGRLAARAPEGYLSATKVAQKLGVDPSALKKIIEMCREDLGELKTYKFRTKPAVGYSPAQQEILGQAIAAHDELIGDAPEAVIFWVGNRRLFRGHECIKKPKKG